jgi:hypothetical protein
MQDQDQAGKIPANDHGGKWVSPMFCKKAIQGGLDIPVSILILVTTLHTCLLPLL